MKKVLLWGKDMSDINVKLNGGIIRNQVLKDPSVTYSSQEGSSYSWKECTFMLDRTLDFMDSWDECIDILKKQSILKF